MQWKEEELCGWRLLKRSRCKEHAQSRKRTGRMPRERSYRPPHIPLPAAASLSLLFSKRADAEQNGKTFPRL